MEQTGALNWKPWAIPGMVTCNLSEDAPWCNTGRSTYLALLQKHPFRGAQICCFGVGQKNAPPGGVSTWAGLAGEPC